MGDLDARTAVDAERVREDLIALDAAKFTSLHVLDRLPAIFESHSQYASWRSKLGDGLGVDALNIVVVGSMSVGVSLSPREDKFLKPVHSLSDVDVAVISPRHFDESWRVLRAWGPVDQLRATSKEAASLLKWHRRALVFDGTIATDKILHYLPFGPAWAAVLGRAGRMVPTRDRDVKARIYRDFESLREYHQRNIDSLKASLTVPEIPEEDAVIDGSRTED